ncbi:hypothetical protein [Streptomyces mirabilis]
MDDSNHPSFYGAYSGSPSRSTHSLHDWEARMCTITEMQPDITKWFDRDVWTRATNDTGFAVTRR